MRQPIIGCICPITEEDSAKYMDVVVRMWGLQTEGLTKLQFLPNKRGEQTTGALRNQCISLLGECDYVAHFDMDDYSAPDRLSVQLAHIQKCGKLAVGFRDMLMYETKTDKVYFYQNPHPHYTLGTSLFYKREAWEKMKFPDKTPEDPHWRRQLGFDNFEGMSSLRADGTPIMIQVIHGANASARIIRGGTYFKEASESQAKAVREILANA